MQTCIDPALRDGHCELAGMWPFKKFLYLPTFVRVIYTNTHAHAPTWLLWTSYLPSLGLVLFIFMAP